MDSYFREQFTLPDILPLEIEEGATSPSIRRDSLGNEAFPHYNKEAAELLRNRFMNVWGNAILEVLGQFYPWRCHIDALEELAGAWMAGDAAVSSLAKDAIFEGVGMYWTLRDAERHWKDEVARGTVAATTVPEIVQAWRLIDRSQAVGKASEFFSARSAKYWGRKEPNLIELSEQLYDVLNTYACQLGALLTVASIRAVHPHHEPLTVASLLVKAWNVALTTGFVDDRRKQYFLRRADQSLNMLSKLDSPDSVHFRYFFLELLASDEAKEVWRDELDETKITRLLSDARRLYRDRVIADLSKSIKRTRPALKEPELQKEARTLADERLRSALKYFFRWKVSDYQEWVDKIGHVPHQDDPSVANGESGPLESETTGASMGDAEIEAAEDD